MAAADVIAEVAKRHGVLLDPGDPVLLIETMLEMHDRNRLSSGDTALISAALDRFVARRFKEFWWSLAIGATLVLVVMAVGMGGLSTYSYRHGRLDGLQAGEQRALQIQSDMKTALAPLSHTQTADWAWLLTLNPDSRSAQANCVASAGRRFCWFKLWIDPSSPPPTSAPPPMDVSPPHQREPT